MSNVVVGFCTCVLGVLWAVCLLDVMRVLLEKYFKKP